MMETQNYWEDGEAHSMQIKYENMDGRTCKDEMYRMGMGHPYCESNLNFATASEDDEVYTKKKVSRQDPMSHRIIEKRRRDRMNNCLADLSRLIPAEYLKKARGRVEKTEIIEMAIRHMKYLQGLRGENIHGATNAVHTHPEDSVDEPISHPSTASNIAADHYRLGFQECLRETMHFLIEVEGFFARDSLCVQLIGHLQQHCDKILSSSDSLGFPHPEMPPSSNPGSTPSFSSTSPMCPSGNGHSDHGSSSGVSSNGESERSQGSAIAPPAIASDDSNHSTHSLIHHDHDHDHEHDHASSTRPVNYKFKSSIKQRFTAERVRPPSPASKTTSMGNDKPHGVPIFALHDAGAFYVPLTIESSLLRPHLSFVIDQGPDLVLHPVTISVNFNQPPSPPLWTHHSQ